MNVVKDSRFDRIPYGAHGFAYADSVAGDVEDYPCYCRPCSSIDCRHVLGDDAPLPRKALFSKSLIESVVQDFENHNFRQLGLASGMVNAFQEAIGCEDRLAQTIIGEVFQSTGFSNESYTFYWSKRLENLNHDQASSATSINNIFRLLQLPEHKHFRCWTDRYT